jgi:hypothetical protein
MPPRTVHTLGGRYKSIEAVEDAPFGELISVRETGLILNAVHPIPILHLRDLDPQERAAVHKYVTSQLSSDSYEGVRFVEAVKKTLSLLETIQQDMDHEPKVTADPTINDTTSNRSYKTAVDCRVTGSLVESINNLTMESGTTPLSQVGAPERRSNIDAWERDITPGRAPSSVSPPSWYLQSEDGSVSQPRSPTRLRKPSRHIDFAKDPTLDKKTRVIVVEKGAASHELALQEEHLGRLESLATTVAVAARRDLTTAIQRARTAIGKVRNLELKCKGALSDSRALVVDALDLADHLWEESEAGNDGALTASLLTQQSVAPCSPGQVSSMPLQCASVSEILLLEQELRLIDDDLSEKMRTLNDVITRSRLREDVIKQVEHVRQCLDSLHVYGERYSDFDDEKLRLFGFDTLETVQQRHVKALQVLEKAMHEEVRLNRPRRAKASRETRGTKGQEPTREKEEFDQAIRQVTQHDTVNPRERVLQQQEAFPQAAQDRAIDLRDKRRLADDSLFNQFLEAAKPVSKQNTGPSQSGFSGTTAASSGFASSSSRLLDRGHYSLEPQSRRKPLQQARRSEYPSGVRVIGMEVVFADAYEAARAGYLRTEPLW